MKNIKFNKILLYALVLIIVVIMATPIYILFRISFSVPQDVLTQQPKFFLTNINFDHWRQVFRSGNLGQPFYKSFIVATATMVLSIIIAAPASYVISRFNKKLRYAVILGLFFTRMFPNVGIALPISVTFIRWNLLDTNLGLIMAHLIMQLPFAAWIMITTFQSIPVDIEHAAMVDGAGRIEILYKVIFPMAAGGIAVAAIYVWLHSWSDFTYALYLSLSTRTLPLQVYYYVEKGGFFLQAAYSVIIAMPVLVITLIIQRYVRSGYLSGAVKG